MKKFNASFFTLVFICLIAGGCQDKSVNQSSSKIEALKLSSATPEDWIKAVEATYEKSDVKNNGDGMEDFVACFQPTFEKQRKCTSYALGKRDAFRKFRFYSSFDLPGRNYVGAYVSLPDNKNPILFLAPHISRSSWLFINKLAIMIDGEVVLEQEFETSKVDRENFSGGIEEKVDFIVTPTQIKTLHKIKPESTVLVRITGEKGYITLDKTEASITKEGIINIIKVFNTLNNSVKDKIPGI